MQAPGRVADWTRARGPPRASGRPARHISSAELHLAIAVAHSDASLAARRSALGSGSSGRYCLQ